MTHTPSPIHIDANIPIYAAGRPHPLKVPCQEVIQVAATSPESFSTDAEVFQELLHYYIAGHNWTHGQAVFNAFATVMAGRVAAILDVDVNEAASLAHTLSRLSARDLLHVAVMRRIGAPHIVSADQDFDNLPGIQRLDPAQVATWRRQFGL